MNIFSGYFIEEASRHMAKRNSATWGRQTAYTSTYAPVAAELLGPRS